MYHFEETEDIPQTVYINGRTRTVFKRMLNKIKDPVKIGRIEIGYGDSLKRISPDEFESLFCLWVEKCKSKGYMEIVNHNTSEKYLRWSMSLDDVEKVMVGMEILREVLK